jgi:hypothetical protein
MATTQSQKRARRAAVKPNSLQAPELERQELSRADRDAFFDQMRADLERLRADPEAWADYQRELREWESASLEDVR